MIFDRLNLYLLNVAVVVMPLFYGDSIAVGYGKDAPGRRRVGASPYEILGYLQQDLAKDPLAFQDKLINLSTGVSNNPDDFTSIQKQLELLTKAGAKINVLGASKQRYGPQNQQLASLSKKFGVNFLGGFEAGSDQVHPLSYSSYNGLNLNQPTSIKTNQSTFTPATTEEKVQKVLAKYKGIAGELNKSTGKFTEREWTPEETKRYDYYRELKESNK